MRAEVVAVGSELLLGQQVDTNSAWISARLAEIGVDVFRHTAVGDNVARMVAVIGEAAGRADAVIVTGGLGPTQDDLTRFAIAQLAGVPLRRHQDLVDHMAGSFARRGRPMPSNNLIQADVPDGARVLAPLGTAAGFVVRVGSAEVFCVPGVPYEMETMVTRDVLPALVARGGLAATVSRTVRTAGLSESGVAETLAPLVGRLDAAGNPTIAFLASGGEVRVRVTGKAADRDAALALVEPVAGEVAALLGRNVIGLDGQGAEHAVASALQARGWTLAVAESITGGNLAARLVSVPGASAWFRGGVLVYATDLKATLAGVPADLLDAEGPLSPQTALALAAGVRERLGADVGCGVVGVAGPDPVDGVEVGTIHAAVALPGAEPAVRTLHFPTGARVQLQQRAATHALDLLRRRLADLPAPTSRSEVPA